MAIPKTSKHFSHWNYFIALEEDLEKVARYIEFSEDNYKTYSIELAHLLLASSSEVDIVLASLCKKLNPSGQNDHIGDYQTTIQNFKPELINEKISIPRYGLELQPFINWDEGKDLNWWASYNKVKHHRDTHFEKANLKNTLNSLAALSLVVLYYYKEILSEERGEELSFKDTSYEFHSKASLINFQDGYTYDNLVA